jgi:hypothetical protein
MRRAGTWLAAIFLLALVGCTTPYGPNGFAGGYRDTKINDNTFEVSFNGNGNTSGDTVWNYWIYRCAELTKANGYTAFSVARTDKKAEIGATMQFAADHGEVPGQEPLRLIPTRSSGGTPIYIYTPGYTITTYSASGIITMYKEPFPREVPALLRAQSVIDSLKPFVDKADKAVAPPRQTIIENAWIPPTQRSL